MGLYVRAVHGSGESLWAKKDPDVGTADISWFSVTGAVQAQMVLPLCLAALFGKKPPWFSLWQGSILPAAAACSWSRLCCLALKPAQLLLRKRTCWYWEHKDLKILASVYGSFETTKTFPDMSYRKGLLCWGELLGFCQMSLFGWWSALRCSWRMAF